MKCCVAKIFKYFKKGRGIKPAELFEVRHIIEKGCNHFVATFSFRGPAWA